MLFYLIDHTVYEKARARANTRLERASFVPTNLRHFCDWRKKSGVFSPKIRTIFTIIACRLASISYIGFYDEITAW